MTIIVRDGVGISDPEKTALSGLIQLLLSQLMLSLFEYFITCTVMYLAITYTSFPSLQRAIFYFPVWYLCIVRVRTKQVSGG